ncbi:MAG: chemotaxis protein [Syntrophobacteraceae bacterium]
MAHNTILLATGTNEMEIVEFYLDEVFEGETIHRGSYGINVAKVLEIIRKPKANAIPLSPPAMVGTFILRDKIIPLIDLAVQLGMKKTQEELNPLAIVTEFNKINLAFIVSGVNRIHRLAWSQIEPAGPIIGRYSNSLTGIVKLDDRNVLILDMEKILAELNPQYAIMEENETPCAILDIQYKALMADDSSSIRNILTRKLENKGFKVRAASDGKVAWEWLQELKALSLKEKRHIHYYVDIVISDVEMPQMDGYSLCQAIKQDAVLKALPVILFSSLINEKQLHRGRSVGADEQITKPETTNLAKRAGELITQFRGIKNVPPMPHDRAAEHV